VDEETRRYAAVLGRRYFAGSVTLETLLEHFGESDDPLIRALLDAVLHEPRKGSLGVSQRHWDQQFWQPVSKLLAELEKGEAGEAPRERIYPRATIRSLLGWSLFTLWAAAAALENLIKLMQALGEPTFPFWRVAFRSLAVAVLASSSWVAIRETLYRIHLYRTRRDPYGSTREGAEDIPGE
jgi:hypothetical protein